MPRDATGFLKADYEALVAQSLNWNIRVLQGPSQPHSIVDGKNVLMLCSNNYLNLSNHPKLKEAAITAVQSHGAGSGSVRAIAGTMDLHIKLEKKIASFKKAEAALYYQTGFAANAGLISQLAGEGDVIISDELNHGSIIDGVRLTKAERAIFKHRDVADLERVLNELDSRPTPPRRILIITDGVFSMDGDIAPLEKIAKLAEEHGAMVYVDDAHGDGVLGEKGRGIVDHFHLHGKVHIDMGTFSKAFGVVGGTVVGSKDMVNFALNKSRTWLLSGSSPPATAAAARRSARRAGVTIITSPMPTGRMTKSLRIRCRCSALSGCWRDRKKRFPREIMKKRPRARISVIERQTISTFINIFYSMQIWAFTF